MNSTIEAVTIKGTRHGLLIAIREDADFFMAMDELSQRLENDKGFLGDSSMSVDLGWREVQEDQFLALEQTLGAREVKMAGILSTSLNTRNLAESRGHKAIIGRLGLSKHLGRGLKREKAAELPPELEPAVVVVEEAVEAEAPVAAEIPVEARAPVSPPDEKEQEATLYIKRTLRSGQKALYPGNVVVMGDVNPGAEIEAEGDVIIIGSLRGKVHAGSAGNPQAQIWAQGMQPTQLRIGDAIWVAEKRFKSPGPVRAVLVAKEIQLQAGT